MVCQEGSYRKHNFSKQDLVFHLILQLLKFVLRYVQQKMEPEWVVYSFNLPLVLCNTNKVPMKDIFRLYITSKYQCTFSNIFIWNKAKQRHKSQQRASSRYIFQRLPLNPLVALNTQKAALTDLFNKKIAISL